MTEVTFGDEPTRTFGKYARRRSESDERITRALNLQIEEKEGDGENGKSDIQRSPGANEIGKGEKNEFAESKEIFNDDASK